MESTMFRGINGVAVGTWTQRWKSDRAFVARNISEITDPKGGLTRNS